MLWLVFLSVSSPASDHSCLCGPCHGQRHCDWRTGGLLWLLPLAGFVLGTINHRAAGTATRGTNFVLDEIYDPLDEGPPLRMTVLMLAGATATQLFGGSDTR